jgi:hypothetical protein
MSSSCRKEREQPGSVSYSQKKKAAGKGIQSPEMPDFPGTEKLLGRAVHAPGRNTDRLVYKQESIHCFTIIAKERLFFLKFPWKRIEYTRDFLLGLGHVLENTRNLADCRTKNEV